MKKERNSRFVSDRSGNIAIVGALTIPLFVGGIAFGTEASNWFVEKSKLSFATDSAAVSAGSLYNRGLSETAIYDAIHAKMIAEGYPASSLALGITYPTPTSDLMTVTTSYKKNSTSVVCSSVKMFRLAAKQLWQSMESQHAYWP